MVTHQANETLRKSLHIAFGLFAFALKLLPWWVAALAAAVAVIGNWIVLHRIVGTRVARHERGWDAGIILYPLMVLLLIITFRNHLVIAAVAWVVLAFGDGFATLAGRAMPLAHLPWNREKSLGGLLAFLIAGTAAGLAVTAFFGEGKALHVVVAVLVAAIAETLPLRADDNVIVPFAVATTFTVLFIHPASVYAPWPRTHVWLIIHTILALVGLLAKSVDVSGAVGGWILGTIILLGGGFPLYVTLLAFFIVGTVCTKIGYGRKAALGLAQAREGRRGFSHAFSNVGVAAICAIAVTRAARLPMKDWPLELIPLFMGIAALATAAADTTASEIGQVAGKHAFLPLSFKRVPAGTEGAISAEGTLAGLIGAGIVAMIGTTAASLVWPISYRTRLILLTTGCAFLGSYLESIVGSWNRRQEKPITNGALNFFNTAAGALLMYFAWQLTR